MKHYPIFFLLLFSISVKAQINVTGTVSQSLPAFFIIDKEPKSVSSPTTPRALAATLLNGTDQNGGLSSDLAVEFAPYWLRDSSKIRAVNNIDANVAWQSFAISIATDADRYSDENQQGRKLGIGFRIQPALHYNSNFQAQLAQMSPCQDAAMILLAKRSDAAFCAIVNDNTFASIIEVDINSDPSLTPARRSAALFVFRGAIVKCPRLPSENNDAYILRLAEFLLKTVKTYSVGELYKSNWKWEVAGAGAIRFPTNKINFSYMHRIGLWTTVSYTHMSSDGRPLLTATGMARTLLSASDSITTNLDLGLSVTARWWPSLPVSLEFTGRHFTYEFDDINQNGDVITRIDRHNTYRLAVTADFAVTEDVSLTFAFGRDYDRPFETSGNLLGIVGLNYTFGTKNKMY